MHPVLNKLAISSRFDGADDLIQRRRSNDRRTRKTRALLHEALGSLIVEKPYESIAVQEILERANVGRSTFYTHFRDKDELLAESLHHMLDSVAHVELSSSGKWYDLILSFSFAVYEHHERHRRAREGKVDIRARFVLHQHLQGILAEMVGEILKRELAEHRKSVASTLPLDLLSQYIASTLVLVLNWSIETRGQRSAKEVNALFRALVLPTLSAIRR